MYHIILCGFDIIYYSKRLDKSYFYIKYMLRFNLNLKRNKFLNISTYNISRLKTK